MAKSLEKIVVDQTLIDFALKDSATRVQKIYRVYLPCLAACMGLSLFLTFKLHSLSKEVSYNKPSFVRPDRSVFSMDPQYRPKISLKGVKIVSEDFATTLLTLHFRHLDRQLENIANMFIDEDAFKQFYLTPLSGDIREKGSLAWIAGNNLIISASSSPEIPPIMQQYYEEGNRMYYELITTAVQTYRGASGETNTRYVALFMTLKEVPRATNINGLQIVKLGMRTL